MRKVCMLSIFIAGRRGQSVSEITRVMVHAFSEQGYHARGIVSGEQNTANSIVHASIRVSKQPIPARDYMQKADYVLLFEPALSAEHVISEYVRKETACIINTAKKSIENGQTRPTFLVNANEYVNKTPALLGFAMLGAFIGATTRLSLKHALDALESVYEPGQLSAKRVVEQMYEHVRKEVILS